jgi:N-acetylglucosaminyldiphosphoundecaprenol N-acetyl-beta-D-mannosaminyltransferase
MNIIKDCNFIDLEKLDHPQKKKYFICTLNAQHLYQLRNDILKKKYLHRLDLTIDSRWIKGFLQLMKRSESSVITGVMIFEKLIKISAKQNKNIYFLGASNMSNKAAIKKYREEHNKVAYGSSPNKQMLNDKNFIYSLMKEFKEKKINYVFLAFGTPYQESCMAKWRNEFESRTEVEVMIGSGAAIDFYSGFQHKCPKWINKIGLEIFYRFFRDISWGRFLRILQSTLGLLYLRKIT